MLLGVDVSFYQDRNDTPAGIDWKKTKAAGAQFAFIRAGQRAWRDEDFAYNWRNSQIAGIPRAAYWYLDWRADYVEQVERFYALVKAQGLGAGELPLILDWEQRTDKTRGIIVPANRLTRMTALRKAIERLEELDNRVPILYTNKYYWREFGEVDDYWLRYPLWIAHYTSEPQPSLPEPWTSWAFWQFSADGNGRGKAFGMESRDVDLNRFAGTLDDLREIGLHKDAPPVIPSARIDRVDPTNYRLMEIVYTSGAVEAVDADCIAEVRFIRK